MAGIEKVCEYSGDYEGGKMYGYKRNKIQVLPKYLKEFKNQKAGIIFFREPTLSHYIDDKPNPFFRFSFHIPTIEAFKKRRLKGLFKYDWDWKYISFPSIPRFWHRDYWVWKKFGYFYDIPSMTWGYCLYVPTLPGNVNGKYFESTRDPVKTIKNLIKIADVVLVEDLPYSMDDFFNYPKEQNDSYFEWIKKLIEEYKEE